MALSITTAALLEFQIIKTQIHNFQERTATGKNLGAQTLMEYNLLKK